MHLWGTEVFVIDWQNVNCLTNVGVCIASAECKPIAGVLGAEPPAESRGQFPGQGVSCAFTFLKLKAFCRLDRRANMQTCPFWISHTAVVTVTVRVSRHLLASLFVPSAPSNV